MRATLSLALLAFLFVPKLYAQTEPSLAPGAQPAGQPAQLFYAEDGGARGGEVLESIVIPPKANAPFSLLLQTEWVRTLPDGETITTENQRRIARDTNAAHIRSAGFWPPKTEK